MERVCWEVKGPLKPIELVRFRADEGWGSDEKFWTLPSVCIFNEC